MSESSKSIRVLANITNCPVVQMPGRSFPGVVIQGDSLKNLYTLASDAIAGLGSEGNEKVRDDIEWILETLNGYLLVYQDTLKEAGVPLPYNEEVQPIPDD